MIYSQFLFFNQRTRYTPVRGVVRKYEGLSMPHFGATSAAQYVGTHYFQYELIMDARLGGEGIGNSLPQKSEI